MAIRKGLDTDRLSNCDVCTLSACSLERGMYCMVGLKFLMVAVIEEAVKDRRTAKPEAAAEPALGRPGRRRARPKWWTADDLLTGKSRGPGGQAMIDFFQEYLNADVRSMAARAVEEAGDGE